MRTPEEIVKEKFGDDLSGYLYVTPYDLITFYKETWNEAIEIAAENAETKEIGDKYGHWLADVIDEDSILKLKK